MDITLEHLQAKRREYETAYLEHIGLANANHGAMEAMQELINLLQAQEKPQEKGAGE